MASTPAPSAGDQPVGGASDRQEIAAEFDRTLLDVLQNGVAKLDRRSGRVVHVSPSAAYLKVALDRIRDVRRNAPQDPRSIGAMMARMAAESNPFSEGEDNEA